MTKLGSCSNFIRKEGSVPPAPAPRNVSACRHVKHGASGKAMRPMLPRSRQGIKEFSSSKACAHLGRLAEYAAPWSSSIIQSAASGPHCKGWHTVAGCAFGSDRHCLKRRRESEADCCSWGGATPPTKASDFERRASATHEHGPDEFACIKTKA